MEGGPSSEDDGRQVRPRVHHRLIPLAARDRAIIGSPSAIRVYAYLLGTPQILYSPQHIKAWLLAEQLGMARDSVNGARYAVPVM